jgi:hypothetical protein
VRDCTEYVGWQSWQHIPSKIGGQIIVCAYQGLCAVWQHVLKFGEYGAVVAGLLRLRS